MSWVMFWTSGDLEADQVMMPDQPGGGVSVAYTKLDESVEIRPKLPDVNLETRPDIKVVRNNLTINPTLGGWSFWQNALKNRTA